MTRDLRVLLSFPPPQAVYNPYTIMLTESVRAQPGVVALNFSWRTALIGRYDVFHVHWPENLANGRSRVKTWVREILTVALLARLRLTRTPVVRTVHNLGLPEGLTRVKRALIRAMNRSTTLFILLNPYTPLPEPRPATVIPIGSFQRWFANARIPESRPGRISFAGRIRRYKGVESLITAFRGLAGPDSDDLRLWIGGLPSTDEMVCHLEELAGGDPRIEFDFGFQSDEDVALRLGESELGVFPYRLMHNSAAVIMALSLGRPVLVPANEVNAALSREVGPAWVLQFEDALTPQALSVALGELRDADPGRPGPNLSARDWSAAGAAHVAAYRRAQAIRRGRSAPGAAATE